MMEIALTLIIIGLIVIAFGIFIFNSYISEEKLESQLQDHYDKEIESITKLTTQERIRYGVPLNIFIKLMFILTRFESHYYRAIEFKNEEDFIYVDALIKRRTIVELNEFEG